MSGSNVMDDDDVDGAADDLSIPTSDRQAPPSADDFTIVETDDDYRPLKPQRDAEITSDDDGQDDQDDQDEPITRAAGDGRPRLTKSERRRNQKIYRERADQELRATREKNEELQRRIDEFEQRVNPRLDQLDQAREQDRMNALSADINQTAAAVLAAERRMSDAVMAGDAEAHSAALREHTLAMQKGNELAQTRQSLEKGGAVREKEPAPRQTQEQPRQQARQPEISPEVARLTRSFVDKHPFLDLSNGGANTDSRIALTLDQEVAADGFDPSDTEYWDELETRMRKYMPHRFPAKAAAREQVPAQRRGPMVAGAGSNSPPGKRTVALTPARRKAMIDAGALDYDGRIADKGQFNRIAAGYAEYDRQNNGSRQ